MRHTPRLIKTIRFPALGLLFATLTSCALFGGPSATSDAPSGDVCRSLTVEVTGFRNAKGHAYAALFRAPEGFPQETTQAAFLIQRPIRNGRAQFDFRDTPCGEYALSALHDENADGKMNVSKILVPLEGFCVSNNIRRIFGPPKFEEARFSLDSKELEISLEMHYILP